MSAGEFSILSVLLVCASILFYAFVRPSTESVTPAPPAVQEASLTAARSAAASPKGAVSIAVLPFLNLSADKDQEFFSDGMTEEITAALAKVPDLRVVARTSAFEFKGRNIEVEKIGQQLHATHLIEGSVRKAGNRLRITAQLIKADDGTHIWAEDYDRELTDVFAIQEDIARAITTSLHMTLGLKPGENLVNNRSIDSGSYEKYLRAMALAKARGAEANGAPQEIRNITEAISLLDDVVAKNPAYTPGWSGLAGGHFVLANNLTFAGEAAAARSRVAKLRARGENAAGKAIKLDPNFAAGYLTLAWLTRSRGDLVRAEELVAKAREIDPVNSEAMFQNAMFAASTGRVKQALEFAEKGYAIDPFYPNLVQETAWERWLNGDLDGAVALTATLRGGQRARSLVPIYAGGHRFEDAAKALDEVPDPAAATIAGFLRQLPRIPTTALPRLQGNATFVYLYLGAPERALGVYERMAEVGFLSGGRGYIWHPDFAPVRKTERFKTVMKKLGFVEYWRAKGWPPQCHPTAGDDFECS